MSGGFWPIFSAAPVACIRGHYQGYMRRFTRLTNAFSKKVENLQAAVSLHFAH